MTIAVVSDAHDLAGFANIYEILDREQPDVLLSCGDWGSNLPTQRARVLAHYSKEFLALTPSAYEDLFKPILDRCRLYTIYGNHDVLDVLCGLRNNDGSRCLLADLVPVKKLGWRVAGINGNIAARHSRDRPWNTTEQKIRCALAGMRGRPDIIMSHEAVEGYADGGKGQPVMREACEKIQPRYWFSGHIHHQPCRATFNNTEVINVGMTLRGEYAVWRDDDFTLARIGT